MEILALTLMSIGFVISLVFGLKLLFIAFRESILWGLACLFIPIVTLIFVLTHWEEAKSPFLMGLLAFPFYLAGTLLMQPTAAY